MAIYFQFETVFVHNQRKDLKGFCYLLGRGTIDWGQASLGGQRTNWQSSWGRRWYSCGRLLWWPFLAPWGHHHQGLFSYFRRGRWLVRNLLPRRHHRLKMGLMVVCLNVSPKWLQMDCKTHYSDCLSLWPIAASYYLFQSKLTWWRGSISSDYYRFVHTDKANIHLFVL